MAEAQNTFLGVNSVVPLIGACIEPAEISTNQKKKEDNPTGSRPSWHFVEANSSCTPRECFLVKEPNKLNNHPGLASHTQIGAICAGKEAGRSGKRMAPGDRKIILGQQPLQQGDGAGLAWMVRVLSPAQVVAGGP